MKLLETLLTPASIQAHIHVASKKKALEYIALHLSNLNENLDNADLFQALVNRERLGSTGLGAGVAIPHCRLAGIEKPMCAFITLDTPIDYEAIDNQPIDILFALVVPEESDDEHLNLLAEVAELFQNLPLLMDIRRTQDNDALYTLMQTCLKKLISSPVH